jgi:hypothetical protein
MAERGLVTGASGRNWASYGDSVQLAPGVTSAQQALLCDPQTSGGLLVACSEDAVGDVMSTFERQGFEGAAVIGTMSGGSPRVSVDVYRAAFAADVGRSASRDPVPRAGGGASPGKRLVEPVIRHRRSLNLARNNMIILSLFLMRLYPVTRVVSLRNGQTHYTFQQLQRDEDRAARRLAKTTCERADSRRDGHYN